MHANLEKVYTDTMVGESDIIGGHNNPNMKYCANCKAINPQVGFIFILVWILYILYIQQRCPRGCLIAATKRFFISNLKCSFFWNNKSLGRSLISTLHLSNRIIFFDFIG